MGDASDQTDVERFMRSEMGQAIMAQKRREFLGRWIRDISFNATSEGVTGTLVFHEGEPVYIAFSELTLARIHEEHEDILDAEYRKDMAKRRPRRGRKEKKRE